MLSIIVNVTRGIHVLTLTFVRPSVEAVYALLPTAPFMSRELEALTLSLRESQLGLIHYVLQPLCLLAGYHVLIRIQKFNLCNKCSVCYHAIIELIHHNTILSYSNLHSIAVETYQAATGIKLTWTQLLGMG